MNNAIVEENNVISLTYELRHASPIGKILEQMDARYPFVFLFGYTKLLPAFEAKLRGLKEGDSFEFTIAPEDAYGPRLSENIMDVPRSAFDAGMLIKDNYVSLTEDNTGERFNGKILSWDEQVVRVDFNHAMAGLVLHFKGVILNIRAASVDELIKGHYIPNDGAHGNKL